MNADMSSAPMSNKITADLLTVQEKLVMVNKSYHLIRQKKENRLLEGLLGLIGY